MPYPPPKSRLSYCKDILQQRRRHFSCLPIRVPVSPEIIEVHPVYSALQEFLNRTFLNLYALDQALLHSDSKGGHFYTEIDEFGKTMSPSSHNKSFASLLITLNDYFSKLEASISAVVGLGHLSFVKLYNYRDEWPDVYSWDRLWNNCCTEDALSVMDTNLNKLDEYISTVVSKYRKPRKITQHWMPYIFGAIGISIFSVWLIRSGIVDNWVLEAKKIFSGEQAVTAVRDEVLETMRSRQKEGMKQVQSTSNLLHRMLMDYERKSPFIPSLRTLTISFGALMISHTLVRQTKAKMRSAVKRRLLLDELEERIMEFQNLSLSNEHGHYINGLVLYTLDHLYKVVERLAKADGEWEWVRNDITLLGDACLGTSDKLLVTSRLYDTYECLLPNTKEELTLRMNVEKHRSKMQGSVLRAMVSVSTVFVTVALIKNALSVA
ncbi:protein DGS1, mitochondrial [Tanacetum coccineum]